MLLVSGMAGAQIVNIPDPHFKAELLDETDAVAKNNSGQWIVIDANNDNEIQVSEALAVWELHIGFYNEMTSTEGINAFSNLRVLRFVECSNIEMLHISNLLNLEKFISQAGSFYGEIQVTNLPNLKYLEISDTPVNIDFSQIPSIETIILDQSDISSFDVSGNQYVKTVWVQGSFFGLNINIGAKPLMTSLVIDRLYDTPSVDVSGCTALENLMIGHDFISMDGPRFLNLKNGVTEYETLNLSLSADSNTSLYVCIDEGNEGLIPANVYANPNIVVSTYCSFTPGGNYNTIAGNLSFDSDNNGCDSNDAYSGFVRMNIDNGTESFSSFTNSGQYNFYTQSGTFTLTPQLENNWFTITPSSAIINLATVDNSTTTQNFCIAANGVHPDVEVVIVPIVAAQPGFDADYKIIYKNKGNQALSGTVSLAYDDAVLDYVAASPVEASSATGSLAWDYSNLLPFESRSILFTLNVNGPMETPAINLDDVFAFTASVTPTSGDETPADNTFVFEQVVVGSYDPNDITCLEGESVDPSKIGEYLHYNIDFENTGTAPATFIVVKDMVDEAKFDINTLQVLYASHAVETWVTGNKVEFYFGDINLAALGKGNVVFKIKTLNTLQVNDDVSQQADIFFDYNWPIETNEAVTVFEVLSLGEYETDHSVKVYPNPAKDRVTITAASQVEAIEVYDIQGRLLQSAIVNDTEVEMDLSSRNTGIYFMKVETDRGMKVEKIIKE